MFLAYVTENDHTVYIKPETVFSMEENAELGLVHIVLGDGNNTASVMVKGAIEVIAHDIEDALTPRPEPQPGAEYLHIRTPDYWWVTVNGTRVTRMVDEETARHGFKIHITNNYGKHFYIIELWHNGRLVANNADVKDDGNVTLGGKFPAYKPKDGE